MTETIKPAAEIQAMALIDDGLALVLGWSERVLPGSGELKVGGQAAAAVAIHTWPRDGGDHWFVAAISGPEVMRLGGPATLTSPNKRVRYELALPRPALDAGALLAELAAMAVAQPPLAGFVEQVLLAEPAPRRPAALFAFLERVAPLDGYIELFGRADGALVLQGWSVRLETSTTELLVEAAGLERLPVAVGTYDRPDLGGSGRGVVAVSAAGGLDPRTVRRAYFRHADRWQRLEVFENRRLLSEAETPAHLTAMQPLLRLDPATARRFKRLAAPRFEGAETVSTLAVPVRAALDLAVGATGAGVFLTGWLLDPERRVAAVTLRGTHGFSRRLDELWHRSARPDVSAGYGADPLFAGRIPAGEDGHGFLATIPCDADPDAAWYLELLLDDDQAAFLPVTLAPPTTQLVRRMLTSVDIRDPAAEAVIARQLGPMVGAAAARLPARSHAKVACNFGHTDRKPRITAVIPVPPGLADIGVTMARFAVDPELSAVELLVVAQAGSAQALGTSLQRAARFFGLFGRLVVTPEALDPCEALELGAAHAAGDLLLFLSPGVFSRRKGWLSQLGKPLLATESAGAVCPTLLWEDESIKFAGQPAGKFAGQRSLSRLAGYPRHWLADEGTAPVPVQSGTVECCLIPKRLFAELGGFARDFVGAEWKGPDFFLRLRATGRTCLWVPTVEMVALDDPSDAAEPDYWRQAGRLVDEWGFYRKWAKPAVA